MSPLTRRLFLGNVSTLAALTLAPRLSWGAEPPPVGRKLGVALVGLGGYSRGQLGPALRQTQYCQLAGVVTGDHAKGLKWAEDYGFPAANIYNYSTMAQLANNPAIDIVYVVTPNGLHAEHCIAAAKAGKHVICEKPMANTVAECDAIITACRVAGVQLTIGYRLFFDPHHAELRRLARDEDFGAFNQMSGERGFVMSTWQWRADRVLAGGGPLMDLGVYLIQGACMAKNGAKPVAVTAQELPKTRPDISRDTEEALRWRMEFADGAQANLMASYQQSADRFRADGARGWIHFKEHAFTYRGMVVETSRGPLKFTPPNQQALQMDAFAQSVLTGTPTPAPGEMGRRDLTIIEAIYASMAAGGQRVVVKA